MKRLALLPILMAAAIAVCAEEFDMGKFRCQAIVGASTKVEVTGLLDSYFTGVLTVPLENGDTFINTADVVRIYDYIITGK
ncbi:MAG: hypothetical protein J6W50_05210 [Bacteroidaceae bacterium]|nr:hypothetical protein [Bacteroidaceae bacterium]MBP5732092.1 hypothetical protein [Bacteroidaceae bacterium]